MMRDPNMQEQMQAMMNAQVPGSAMMPGTVPPVNNNAPNASGTAQQNNASGNNAGPSDQEMTEEEMIAEAIQRSLREI